MKKFLQRVVLVAMAMATAQVAVAESWRINNDTSKGAHFASINDAMASELVKDGDVLYLDPGANITGDQTITKAVTVIGTGWDFNDKPYSPATISANLYVKSQATLTGIKMTGKLYPQYNNIVIQRCAIYNGIEQADANIESKYVKIINCYVEVPTRYTAIRGAGTSNTATQSWEIYNSYISSGGNGTHSVHYLYQPVIVNCIIYCGWNGNLFNNITNGTIKNNILLSYDSGGWIPANCSGCSVINNCVYGANTLYPNNTVGFTSRDFSQVVIQAGTGGSWMQLIEGSPAIGAGEGGIDCGPYAKGSLYPFVTYGMPKHIPYFTEAAVPAQPTDGKVKVSLKIVNQND